MWPTADLATFTEKILNGKLHFCVVQVLHLIILRVNGSNLDRWNVKINLWKSNRPVSNQTQPPELFCKKKVFLEILQNSQENALGLQLY